MCHQSIPNDGEAFRFTWISHPWFWLAMWTCLFLLFSLAAFRPADDDLSFPRGPELVEKQKAVTQVLAIACGNMQQRYESEAIAYHFIHSGAPAGFVVRTPNSGASFFDTASRRDGNLRRGWSINRHAELEGRRAFTDNSQVHLGPDGRSCQPRIFQRVLLCLARSDLTARFRL